MVGTQEEKLSASWFSYRFWTQVAHVQIMAQVLFLKKNILLKFS